MPVEWLTDTTPAHGLDEPVEEAHSATVQFTNEQLSADVVLRCRWDQRYSVLWNILTKMKEWPYLPGSGIYAESGTVNIPASSQALRDDPAGYGLTYNDALLSVHFSTMSGAEQGSIGGEGPSQSLYTESIEPNAEFLKLHAKNFHWTAPMSGDAATEEEAGSRLTIGADYVVRWQRLATVPDEAVTLLNHVNEFAVVSASLGKTFAVETLLFSACTFSRTVTTVAAENLFDLEARFSWRKDTWNKFWRQKTQAWEEMYYGVGPDAYKNYPVADFTGLLP